MKYYFIILFFLTVNYQGFCKKYVIIDLNQPTTNEVIMGNGSTNFPKTKIYLYNKWLRLKSETFLITASILPDITNGKTIFNTLTAIPTEYEIVDIDQIAIQSINYYFNNCNKITFDSKYPLKTTEFTVILKKENKYLIASSNTCLFEFYKYSSATPTAIEDYNYISLYPYGTLYSREDISKIQHYLHTNFKGDIHYLGKLLPSAKSENSEGKEEFTFWITNPPLLDVGWEYFGIEEFRFIPFVGIIAGTFVQYLKGGTGSIVNQKISHFEQNTKLFTAITINGIPFAKFLQNMNKY